MYIVRIGLCVDFATECINQAKYVVLFHSEIQENVSNEICESSIVEQ